MVSISYLKACAGVILVCGSHSRQRLRKSINNGSSQFFNACDQSLLPGGPRCFPRLERPEKNKNFRSNQFQKIVFTSL
jgi:hypothetical protein